MVQFSRKNIIYWGIGILVIFITGSILISNLPSPTVREIKPENSGFITQSPPERSKEQIQDVIILNSQTTYLKDESRFTITDIERVEKIWYVISVTLSGEDGVMKILLKDTSYNLEKIKHIAGPGNYFIKSNLPKDTPKEVLDLLNEDYKENGNEA